MKSKNNSDLDRIRLVKETDKNNENRVNNTFGTSSESTNSYSKALLDTSGNEGQINTSDNIIIKQ